MSKFGFDRVLQNIETLKRDLPIKLANQAENYFVKTFTKQGFNNRRWQEVRRRIPGTGEYKYPKKKGLSRRTKPILIGTGRLRRAVANSKRSATMASIRLVVDLPYAAAQNYGNKDLVPRQFMGDNLELRKEQVAMITKEIDKTFHKK